ncbi:DUF4097 family beta strand repeat-containing protein [Gudongella sp. DL1XJH-153]|uniref:DUF4097 family beta strand repeat-containing protein n=1 Tax=Gudongella sp. DL1XJH-153 TaxID=3409804 RepID=UPI003BB4DE7E
MDLKRLSLILAGVVLIAFGVGIYSLLYIDDFNIDDIAGEGGIEITNNGDTFEIGSGGIMINENGKSVSINWDGIEVVEDGNKTVVGIRDISFFERINIFSNLKSYEADESKSTNLSENIDSVSIHSTFANTRVYTSDNDELIASLKGSYKSNRAVSLDIQDIGNNIKVSVTPETGGFTVSQSNLQLEIYLPSTFDGSLDFKSSSADFEAVLIDADVASIESSSGNIRIGQILASETKIVSSSGEIEIISSTGKISIASSSGNITFSPIVPLGDIRVTTSSGNIRSGPLKGLPLEVKATTSSGRISYEGSAKSIQNDGYNLRMTLEEGSYNMDLASSSGNITLFE